MPVGDLVGSPACAECHRAIYEKWQRSPHGRAMTLPSAETVRGNFSGAVHLPDGEARLGPGFTMELDGRAGADRRNVDLVLASGRQHQLYVTRDDGSYRLLPLIWATQTHEWLPTAMYQPGDLDPRSKNYWANFDLTRGCFSCHLSQSYRFVGKTVESRWVELSIDCESCHGPGREHIARRRAGGEEVYRNLHNLDKFEESRVCGQCHGFSVKPYVFPRDRHGLPEVFVTSLINAGLRPDATQFSTSYQYPAHVLSQCFRKGSLTCNGCHEPHGLSARNFAGESAVGEFSDRQCTICHRDKTPAHAQHKKPLRCVDCHMSYSNIDDDERRRQRTADHSISIPRPEESIRFGTPNACVSCHKDKPNEWARDQLKKRVSPEKNTEVRDWVETIFLARKKEAADRLIALLSSDSVYLQTSALDLLLLQPADPKLIPILEPFARSEHPELRASAIRALLSYDAPKWAAIGLADAHPFVRMEIFSFIKDVSLLTPESIERDLADTLAYKNPPTDGLVHLITVRHKRRELKEARTLLELLERYSTPAERARLDVDAVRARLR